ncbi:MAG: iron-containing alcohol dehydrogenase [Bacilli bacterium]|nr:iron-containing alcohol dehydrogenase [Bacilli bacterium]
MNPFRFQNPTALYYGSGQIEQHLETEVKKYGDRVLLVYGGGSIKSTGLYDKVLGILGKASITVYELPGIEPNPRLSSVNKGISICRENQVDLILAVGGGSVIDAAKAIAGGVKYEGNVWDFYTRRARAEDALPLGTILTLSATGSEMNGTSVISNLETEEKRSTSALALYPRFSFCDPANTLTVPKNQTVYGIVDMMSHVFEQYFTHTEHVMLQEQMCESLLRTIIAHAKPVLEDPANYHGREALMYCSTMALNGIISMGVEPDWACHAIEHVISAYYDIPHGGGLAIVFPNWMKHVASGKEAKFARLAVQVFDIDAKGKSEQQLAFAGIAAVRSFFDEIGAPRTLGDYGIGEERIEEMAAEAAKGWGAGTIGNFQKLTKSDIESILRMCLTK